MAKLYAANIDYGAFSATKKTLLVTKYTMINNQTACGTSLTGCRILLKRCHSQTRSGGSETL